MFESHNTELTREISSEVIRFFLSNQRLLPKVQPDGDWPEYKTLCSTAGSRRRKGRVYKEATVPWSNRCRIPGVYSRDFCKGG